MACLRADLASETKARKTPSTSVVSLSHIMRSPALFSSDRAFSLLLFAADESAGALCCVSRPLLELQLSCALPNSLCTFFLCSSQEVCPCLHLLYRAVKVWVHSGVINSAELASCLTFLFSCTLFMCFRDIVFQVQPFLLSPKALNSPIGYPLPISWTS